MVSPFQSCVCSPPAAVSKNVCIWRVPRLLLKLEHSRVSGNFRPLIAQLSASRKAFARFCLEQLRLCARVHRPGALSAWRRQVVSKRALALHSASATLRARRGGPQTAPPRPPKGEHDQPGSALPAKWAGTQGASLVRRATRYQVTARLRHVVEAHLTAGSALTSAAMRVRGSLPSASGSPVSSGESARRRPAPRFGAPARSPA